MRLAHLVAPALGAGLVLLFACGGPAVGVNACKAIESARCAWGPACGVDLNVPVRRSDSTSPVDDCIRYYDDACLHGIVGPNEPAPQQTNDCVTAINSGNCAIVLEPQTSPACSFLLAVPVADSGLADTSLE